MKSRQLESILNGATSATPLRIKPSQSAAIVPMSVSDAAREEKPEAKADLVLVAAPAPETQKPVSKAEPKPKPEAKSEPVPAAAVAREKQKPVSAYLPASVVQAMHVRGATEGLTTRAMILMGLRSIGFEIADEEIRDRRK